MPPPPASALDAPSMSEGCLFLNIFTTKSNMENMAHKLVPVMLWVHGGGFMGGSGSQYNGSNFVSQYEPVVMVTVNYRLGALGFFSNEQLHGEDPHFKSYGG